MSALGRVMCLWKREEMRGIFTMISGDCLPLAEYQQWKTKGTHVLGVGQPGKCKLWYLSSSLNLSIPFLYGTGR